MAGCCPHDVTENFTQDDLYNAGKYSGFKKWFDALGDDYDNMHDAAFGGYCAATRQIDIEKMTAAFLGWELPIDFAPDGGVSFDRVSGAYRPTGTNLLTHTQARMMIKSILQATGYGGGE